MVGANSVRAVTIGRMDRRYFGFTSPAQGEPVAVT